MKFTIVTYYDDPECLGDYHSIEVYRDDVKLASYGDYYHDKGEDKAEAFCEGFAVALQESFSIKYKNIYKEI